MKLLVVLPFCPADTGLAENLLSWIEDLGRLQENECLLVKDCRLEEQSCQGIQSKARRVFKRVRTIQTPFALPDEKWPIGPNWMFETALREIIKHNTAVAPWLWLEPDCVPMRASWLKEIESVYERCGRPCMGQVVVPDKQGLPKRMLSGVAVYPSDPKLLQPLLKIVVQSKTRAAWDVAAAELVTPLSHNSSLFWNFIGGKNLPPTFVRRRGLGHPENALELSSIPKTTALFHRCKDGSLTGLLKGDGEPTIPQLLMAFKTQTMIVKGGNAARVEAVRRDPLFYHAVERHPQKSADADRRILTAHRSWERLYKTGRLKPCHLWDFEYPRDARQVGDKRALPFLKDVLVPAMTKARDLDDVIVWTNDDSILHPKILDAIADKLRTVDACGSFRVNFEKIEASHFETEPNLLAQRGKHDLGRDLFAFKKRWLRSRWLELPDFLIGELEFDLVVATMIRRDAGVFTTKVNWDQLVTVCEIDKGYLLHEIHERDWVNPSNKNSAAKAWNRDLAVKFYAERGFASLISNF